LGPKIPKIWSRGPKIPIIPKIWSRIGGVRDAGYMKRGNSQDSSSRNAQGAGGSQQSSSTGNQGTVADQHNLFG